MKIDKKIQAFTLSEMIVVLILTSIVVGLAFSILTLVQRQMSGIQNNFNQSTQINKLEQSLWLDFNRHSTVEYNTIEEELIFISEINSTSYKFNESYIIKGIDTFQIMLESKSFFFDGNPIEKGVIDAIKLTTTKTFQNQQMFVFKQSDATPYLN